MARALVLVVAAALLAVAPAEARRQPRVVVNGVRLAPALVSAVERRLGLRIAEGAYWYDRVSGAFGRPGGPTAGFVPAGLPLGGRLAADASHGRTGVFVNGRELPAGDLAAVSRAIGGPVPRGRYWLDARGDYGVEGGPAEGNVIAVAHRGGGYQRSTYGGYVGSDGRTSFYFDGESGCSVVPGAGVSC